MNFSNSQGGILLLLGAVAVVGAAAAAVPVIWRAIRAMAKVPGILDGVAAEFTPNGGSSLKDGINRLASAAEQQTKAFNEHIEKDENFQQLTREFEVYTHTRFHDLINQQTKMEILLTMPRSEREDFAETLLKQRADDPSPKGKDPE